MLLEISGEITPERMKGWNQRKKQHPAVDVTGMEVKSNAVKSNNSSDLEC